MPLKMYPPIFFTDEISLPNILTPLVTLCNPLINALMNLFSLCFWLQVSHLSTVYKVSKSLGSCSWYLTQYGSQSMFLCHSKNFISTSF